MKKQNIALERELNEMKETLRLQEMMKQYVTTRDAQMQTDPPKSLYSGIYTQPKKPAVTVTSEAEKTNKLLTMHNGLMKRYEKEMKTNIRHVETITSLNIKVTELEQKLKQAEDKIHRLERDKGSSSRLSRRSRSRSGSPKQSATSLQRELTRVKRERDKLLKIKQKLTEELKGLDHSFFEEIEDLKYTLQESTKLNKQYEKSLRTLCSRFGVPYPHPEKRCKTQT
ncbi:centrosomal protein of 290 kDa [Lingula anatina]|uniref:Centrosomal protein of 290 kDa n=1 Tax=Lingula anatina TaxID=7574 RepID=A0A1S3H8D6_LINAN|nr:centrosomal protein of 290 kDa [Lingula anatina]|eukprot:XP_013381384.1 centrosomal protein of 290 kDa [Lingula anatina]